MIKQKKAETERKAFSRLPPGKAIGLSVLAHGSFAVLLAILPHYSPTAMTMGVGLTAVGTLAAFLIWRWQNWWAQVVWANVWLLLILGIGARFWVSIILVTWARWAWLVLLFMLYLLAWVLPRLSPSLSAFLYREQYAPETRPGQTIIRLLIAVGPAAGVLGSLAGIYVSGVLNYRLPELIAAVLFSIVALGLTQAVSHHLWTE